MEDSTFNRRVRSGTKTRSSRGRRMGREGKSKRSESRSFIYCSACNVALCCSSIRNCFLDYHKDS